MNQELVRRLFDYDPETGELTRKVAKNYNALAGAKAGCPNSGGYLLVRVNRKKYPVHRVIWLWVYGYLPEHQIDHINRDKTDNRLANLREVTHQCNVRNSNQRTDNTSSVTGVCWAKREGKWVVMIKHQHLGYFKDFTEAVSHRLSAEQCLNWEGCDSSSDAFKYLQELRNG